MNKVQPHFTTAVTMAENLADNNMLYRLGNIVEIGEPQDAEHEATLSPHDGGKFVIAHFDAKRETYHLYEYDRYVKSSQILPTQYVGNGLEPIEFIDADLVPAVPEVPFDIDIDSIVSYILGHKQCAASVYPLENGKLQCLYNSGAIMDIRKNGDFDLYSDEETLSCNGNLKYYTTPRDMEKEVTEFLKELFVKIGIDKPENYEEIHRFVVDDVSLCADPTDYHTGDMEIAFRRFLELKSNER